MSGRWNQLSPYTKLLVFGVAAILAFGMAAGIGAVAALMVSDNPNSPSGEATTPEQTGVAGKQVEPTQRGQTDAEVAQRQYSGGKRGPATPQDGQTAYVDEVGEIQDGSVDAFSDSHQLFLRYDALASDDVEKLRADQAALKKFAGQAGALGAPQKYEDHKDLFRSAIEELHQAARLAYVLAADPIGASQADFDHYDRLVDEAAADLQRSNEILGRNYKTVEGLKGVETSR